MHSADYVGGRRLPVREGGIPVEWREVEEETAELFIELDGERIRVRCVQLVQERDEAWLGQLHRGQAVHPGSSRGRFERGAVMRRLHDLKDGPARLVV